ncbi:1,4-dihydroxy-2-naphthoate polyprenyltransferase [Actinomycetaceae bacterium TAE3-ERU4]|nr:1,4-dihydroxy-2-naphthoate polyprenyltransferase [Actinomycetaceae bacterium TAE3-ERU4]
MSPDAPRKATFADWVEGARLRTLPAALAPVILGTAAAYNLGGFSFTRAFLALLVALGLQVGVNYANDYSDGIRGTDSERVGPLRLTGAGLAKPKTVLLVALACFSFASLAGLILLALSGDWWLIICGLCAVIAAWFYTGGKRPYGYLGLGEVMVIVFFGFLATQGTLWTQAHRAPMWSWLAALSVGLLSAALLMVNNIRDIKTDTLSGKLTLAVRLGDKQARSAYALMILGAYALGVICALGAGSANLNWLGLLIFLPAIFGAFWLIPPVTVRRKTGPELILVLKHTGLYTLVFSLLLGAAIVAGA